MIDFEKAPITIYELKGKLFLPLLQANKFIDDEIIYQDDSCTIRFKGKALTQLHRDILDIVIFFGDKSIEQKLKDNVPFRAFSLYSILKQLGHKSKRNSKWLRNKINEIRDATITYTNKKSNEIYQFSIVKVFKNSSKLNSYIMSFDDRYFEYSKTQLSISYKNLVDEIISLKYPATKAVIRYILTHSDKFNIGIDNMLKKVGVTGSQRNFEKIRNNVLSELKEHGNKFNIKLIKKTKDKRKISDYSLKYKRDKNVFIQSPKK